MILWRHKERFTELSAKNRINREASVIIYTPRLENKTMTMSESQNVLGGHLEACCFHPKTGFFRDGFCNTDPQDRGLHIVCAHITSEFLEFSKYVGNNLSTPRPDFDFPGLQTGDRWCLCGMRWIQAHEAGKAPGLLLKSTHQKMLELVPLDILLKYAIDVN